MNDEIGTKSKYDHLRKTSDMEKSGRKTVRSTAENIPAVITTNVLVPWEVSGH